VSSRAVRIALGVLVIALGGYLVASPLWVADVLDRPHATSSQLINLRATWGGPVLGLGAFLAWLPGLRPWPRTGLGLLLWVIGGVAVARALGFVLDGSHDGRQWTWLILELVIVVGAALGLRVTARRAATGQVAVRPPSTTITEPVVNDAASDSR
jgi:hypothetical protein